MQNKKTRDAYNMLIYVDSFCSTPKMCVLLADPIRHQNPAADPVAKSGLAGVHARLVPAEVGGFDGARGRSPETGEVPHVPAVKGSPLFI